MVRLHAATLPLASNIVLLVADITEMGFSAAVTALNAFTMPAPHWPVTQEHWPEVGSVVGHTGRFPVLGGNGVALDCMRAISCGGVKFALTARMSAAIPETMGAEK